jgi:hypothetical protein
VIDLGCSHQLDTDQSGYQEQEEDKNRKKNQHEKIVSHRKPDKATKASVWRWPGHSWHPGEQKHKRYDGDTYYCVPLAAWSEPVLFVGSDHDFDAENQGDVPDQKNSYRPSVSLSADRKVC